MSCQEDHGLEGLDIYLKKDSEIIGLHAIGHTFDGKFHAMDRWGNEYTEDYKVKGRGSFRVHGDLEETAKEFESEGWTRFNRVG